MFTERASDHDAEDDRLELSQAGWPVGGRTPDVAKTHGALVMIREHLRKKSGHNG